MNDLGDDMTNKVKNVPKIRFSGYTHAWEKRKLGNIYNFSISTNSLSRSQLNYDKGEIKNIHYGDILVNYSSILDVETDKIPFITDGTLDKYKPNLLKNGDVIFADAAEDDTVGKAVEVNGLSDENLVSGLHTIVARPKEKMADYFSGYYINSDTYHRQLLRLIQGTKVSSISKRNLQKTIISYPPNLDEQTKIGQFFQFLDDLITLHQRKCTMLKNLKKGYLQKMFPKGNEKIPEIRFEGFNEEWENKKLGVFYKKYQDTTYLEDDKQYRQVSIRNTGIIEYRTTKYGKEIGRKRQYLINTKDYPVTLTFTRQTIYEGGIGYIPHELNGAIVTENMPLLEKLDGIDKEFSIALFNTKGYRLNVIDANMPIGSAQKALHEKSWLESFLLIPLYKEQTKIGNFFHNLDQQITQQEVKIKHLKQLKQAYLQNMFV